MLYRDPSQGVNLPTHAVICKGTDVYDPQRGGNVDLSMLMYCRSSGERRPSRRLARTTLLTSSKSLPTT